MGGQSDNGDRGEYILIGIGITGLKQGSVERQIGDMRSVRGNVSDDGRSIRGDREGNDGRGAIGSRVRIGGESEGGGSNVIQTSVGASTIRSGVSESVIA